jgi:hypothetical protein
MNKDDWGIAEQNAYERMRENDEGISVEKFLEWLDKLKNGENV